MDPCPHCGHSLDAPTASCPSCGELIKAPRSREGRQAKLPYRRERFVSSAGPSMPVRKPTSDAVPSGNAWMQRLEAARQAAFLEALPEVEPDAEVVPSAPPAKGSVAPGNGFQAKPAHLLIAELEEDEKTKKNRRAAPAPLSGVETSSIANVVIEKPAANIEHKRVPTWLIGTIVGVVCLGGAFAAYRVGFAEPTPEVAANAELARKLEASKKAVALLEEGHRFAMVEKPDEAIAAYSKALELKPDLAKAHKGLGAIYAKRKDVPKMVEHYRMYLELDPGAEDAAKVREILEKHEDDPMRPKASQ